MIATCGVCPSASATAVPTRGRSPRACWCASRPANVPNFSARCASSGVHENSARVVPGLALSLASRMFESETDLLPCSSRTFWSFGRLMPTAEVGPASPVSTTTSIALATMPLTFGLRYFGIPGHAVLEPLRVVRERSDPPGLFLVHVEDDRLPRPFDAARVEVDLDEAVDGVYRRVPCPATQATSYFTRSASSPVRYHCTSARSAFAIGSEA